MAAAALVGVGGEDGVAGGSAEIEGILTCANGRLTLQQSLPEQRLVHITAQSVLSRILRQAGFVQQHADEAAGSAATLSAHSPVALTYPRYHGMDLLAITPLPSTTPSWSLHATSFTPCPGFAFARRVERLLVVKRALLHTNALVSTLGGGHFMCGHLDTAKALAARQLTVARALGDSRLFGRVHMHYVYIALHEGNFPRSAAIAAAVQAHALAGQDSELASMAHAALVLATRLAAAVVPDAAPGAELAGAGDDFARYRGALAAARAGGAAAP